MIKKSNTRINVTVPRELYQQLKELADYQDRSVSNLVLNILKHYVKSIKKPPTD